MIQTSSLLVILVTLCSAVSTKYVGDTCFKSNAGPGTCVLITDCPEAIYDIQNFQRFPQRCGFQGSQLIVCCLNPVTPNKDSVPKEETPRPPNPSKNEITTTSAPLTERTNSPGIVLKGPRKPGAVSRQKCLEYAKLVYVRQKEPTLVIDKDEVEIDECGFKVIPLIVGGTLARRREFPHMALIGYQGSDEVIHWSCGGALISEEYVLTAGHCLFARGIGKATHIRMGVANINDPIKRQEFTIAESIYYPAYVPPSHYDDIALLKLDRKANLNPFARPACLWASDTIYNRSSAIASGWGRKSFTGHTSDDLLKVVLNLYNNNNCSSYYDINKRLVNGIKDTQLCAGAPNKDTCQGDSGGPLQIYSDVKCMYELVGVTSFGKPCGLGDSPGVYTKISKYIKWIEDIVWK